LKKLDFGQTVGLFANIGVVAGIVFLGIELRQNNESLAVQARMERENARRNGASRGLGDPAYIGALLKSQRGETLTYEEELVLELYARAALVDWQLRFGLAQDGLLDDPPGLIEGYRVIFHREGSRYEEAWESFEKTPGFARWMEENIVNNH